MNVLLDFDASKEFSICLEVILLYNYVTGVRSGLSKRTFPITRDSKRDTFIDRLKVNPTQNNIHNLATAPPTSKAGSTSGNFCISIDYSFFQDSLDSRAMIL